MHALPEITLAIEVSNPGADAAIAPGVPAIPGSGPAPRSGVALGRATPLGIECLAMEWLSPRSRHDDALMPAIAELARRTGHTPRDINRIAVSIGPGGYTSLRIGVTIAKLIAEATGAACIGVPTADAVVCNLGDQLTAEQHVRVCLAWKRDSVWMQDFVRSGAAQLCAKGEGRLVSIEQAAQSAPPVIVAEAPLAEMLNHSQDVRIIEPVFDPRGVLKASFNRPTVDPLHLAPLYPREPEAVSKWRELHPR